MSLNLKARLGRIRVNSPGNSSANGEYSSGSSAEFAVGDSWHGWTEAGYRTLKREQYQDLSFSLPVTLPETMPILVPDLFRIGRLPSMEELLFFDLETTGLSGGAGTLAFLAAFGRFVVPPEKNSGDKARLKITQYLLLDYPGEGDFIEWVVKEFSALKTIPGAALSQPIVVTYNGKCFDSQILKNRCLMNGIMVPGYFHADLLHPARRLWKRQLPDCSQATIEVSVLGLDRTGDVPGAMAPDIWFSFLRKGENGELLLICDHNAKDIMGLASLFLALSEISAAPFDSRKKFRFDEEGLALTWREAVRKGFFFSADDAAGRSCEETGELLLEDVVKRGCPRALFILGLDRIKTERRPEGRALLKKALEYSAEDDVPCSLQAAALASLAIDSEWYLGDPGQALAYTTAVLNLPGISKSGAREFEKRRIRLEEKIKNARH